jgi:acetolactate decarboxylase
MKQYKYDYYSIIKGMGLGLLMLVGAVSCSSFPEGNVRFDEQETLSQVSTIDALLIGAYDGVISIGDLKRFGDFGLGTFHALDGEMAMVSGTNVETFQKTVDEELPTPNLFYALRIDGTFEYMKTRSVPAQQKPYPPLAAVTENQPEFEFREIAGTVIGFRCPPFVTGINVPGYHLHFLSRDKQKGGHVLAFILKEGKLRIDTTPDFFLMLPEEGEAYLSADLARDRAEELHRVEK